MNPRVAALLAELRRQRIALKRDGDELRFKATAAPLPDALRADLRESKAEVLEALAAADAERQELLRYNLGRCYECRRIQCLHWLEEREEGFLCDECGGNVAVGNQMDLFE
jgi:hypothetical protein